MPRRTATLASLLGAAALVSSTTVIAAGAGGRVDLQSPERRFDSRLEQGGHDGNEVTSHEIGSGVFMVWAFYPTGSGTAVIHPCSEPAPADESTFILEPDSIQYARFATSETVCLTSTVPTHVIVDQYGTTTATPEPDRLQYVAFDTALSVFDGSSTKRSQTLRLPRPAALPATAGAAVVSLDVPAATAPGFLTAHGCDSTRPNQADVHYETGLRKANIAYVEVGPDEDLCVFALAPADIRVRLLGHLSDDGPNPTSLPPSWRYVPTEEPAPSLNPIVPERVLDTRFAIGRPGVEKVEPDEVVELDFGSLIGPATSAVVLNVTVTEPEANGFITAWPCGGDRPTVSNLNFAPGDTVPNLVISKLGPSGTVCLSGIARTHLIADVNGTFDRDGGLRAQPIEPNRILDTRFGVGVATTTKVPAGEVLELQIVGDAVPAAAGAATINVTVTQPDGPGFITAYPCDEDRPEASNLNYAPGQTVPNLVTAKLSADGTVCLFTLADTHLIADLAAWYGPDQPAGLVELDPERFLDTRFAIGTSTTTKVAAGEFVAVQIAGVGDVPPDADAVVMNLTVTEPDDVGFVTAWPCDQGIPTVSNLNYAAGETNPNLATVKLAADGTVCLFTRADAHLIADVSGYLTENVVTQDLVLQDAN